MNSLYLEWGEDDEILVGLVVVMVIFVLISFLVLEGYSCIYLCVLVCVEFDFL